MKNDGSHPIIVLVKERELQSNDSAPVEPQPTLLGLKDLLDPICDEVIGEDDTLPSLMWSEGTDPTVPLEPWEESTPELPPSETDDGDV